MADHDGHSEQGSTDLWTRMQESAALVPRPAPLIENTAARQAEKSEAEKAKWRRKRRVLDVVGAGFWIYAFLRIFVVDVDREVLGVISEDGADLVRFRVLVYIVLAVAAAATIKRSGKYILYLAFFPVIVIFWKIPKRFVGWGSWMPVVALVHLLTAVSSSFQYQVVTKGLGVFAVLGSVVFDQAWIVVPSCVYLVALLVVSYGRAVKASFTGSAFLNQQERLIQWVLGVKAFDVAATAEDLKVKELEHYSPADVQALANAINARIICTRGLYLWAYQLDRYRRTPAAASLYTLSYVSLFIGSAITFSCVNLGAANLNAEAFTIPQPSVLTTALYSCGSLAFSDLGRLSPVSTGAELVSLLAGVCGVVFLATFVLAIGVSVRREMTDHATGALVRRLKDRARDEEARLTSIFDADIRALVHFLDLAGANLVDFVLRWTANLPADFMDLGDDDTEH